MSASKRCQMNRTRVFMVVVLGRTLMLAPYAPPRSARTPSSETIVVASICGPAAATTGGGGGGRGGGAGLLPQKDMVRILDVGVRSFGAYFSALPPRLDRRNSNEAQKKLV